jgi:hypothetical protein
MSRCRRTLRNPAARRPHIAVRRPPPLIPDTTSTSARTFRSWRARNAPRPNAVARTLRPTEPKPTRGWPAALTTTCRTGGTMTTCAPRAEQRQSASHSRHRHRVIDPSSQQTEACTLHSSLTAATRAAYKLQPGGGCLARCLGRASLTKISSVPGYQRAFRRKLLAPPRSMPTVSPEPGL